MDTFNATITRKEESVTLSLHVQEAEFNIILTEDNPNNVKAVFNSLLKELKKGLFTFELHDTTEDLYFHICNEYIKQLNSELESVHKELEAYQLTDD